MENNSELISKVLNKFIISMAITTFGIFIGLLAIPVSLAIFCGTIAFIFLLVTTIIKIFSRKDEDKSKLYGINLPLPFVYGFSLLTGISLYPLIQEFSSSTNASMVVVAIVVTTIIFAAVFNIGYRAKRDFSFLGMGLFFGLIAIIIMSIVGMIINLPFLNVLLAWIGAVIFIGYILYDVSVMKRKEFSEKDIPMAVLNLYLDFINLFIDIIRIFRN